MRPYAERFAEGRQELAHWLTQGTLKYREDIARGVARRVPPCEQSERMKREKSRDLFSKGVAHEFEELAGCL